MSSGVSVRYSVQYAPRNAIGMVVMMLRGSKKLSNKTPMMRNTKVIERTSAITCAVRSSSSISWLQLRDHV